MDRSKTYVEKLDDILQGGVPRNNIVLLAGGAGSGKSTLSLEFLFKGISEGKEKGMYFAVTEPEVKLVENVKKFNFFNAEYLQNSDMMIIDLRTISFSRNGHECDILNAPEELLNFMAEQLSQFGPRRVVIDSLTAICKHFEDPKVVRKFIYDLGNLLIAKDCTSLLISEVSKPDTYSHFEVEEFICDGIISMKQIEKNNRLQKTLRVVKMRGTDHRQDQYLVKISPSGIQLLDLMQHQ